MDTSILFKYRSVTACMKVSYDTITSNITSLLKKTWWASLALAFLTALTLYFMMPNKALHDWGIASPWSSYIIQTLVYLGTWLATFVYGAAIWTWINHLSFKTNLIRNTIVCLIFQVIIFLIVWESNGIQTFFLEHTAHAASTSAATAVAEPTQAMADGASFASGMAICAILGLVNFIIMMLFFVPFQHVLPQVMLKKPNEKWEIWKSFKTGFHHFGSLFKMVFLGAIIIGIMMCIIFIPIFILTWIQLTAQLGALDGDPLGLPSLFPLLVIVVFTLVIFIFLYIASWLTLSYAFLFGSNHTRDLEKIERMKEERIEEERESRTGIALSHETQD